MLLIHDKMSRGCTRTGWLDSFHTFSFGGFQDPSRMGFGPLRVLNDDRIIPGSGFSAHPHDSMDILTYVLAGSLRHEDSLGTVSTIGAGEVQLMSAGTGIVHSERNGSDSEPAHLLQIWLMPDVQGGAPGYQQRAVDGGQGLQLLAGGTEGLILHSDSRVWLWRAAEEEAAVLPLRPERLGFLHIVDGLALAGGERISAGDALQVSGEEMPEIRWLTAGEALWFDLPA